MGKACVLVIEDEERIRQVIHQALAPSYDVEMASDGAQGLTKAHGQRPDLILLDLRLPDMDGFSVLARLKADDATRSIPVIIVSAKGDTAALLEGERARAADYLIKPFDVEALRSTIRRHLLR